MNKGVILFDLDGTLAKSSFQITKSMVDTLKSVKNNGYDLGIVTGGSYKKVEWQLNGSHDIFKYIYTESGATSRVDNKVVYSHSVFSEDHMTNVKPITKTFIDWCDNYKIKYSGSRVDIRKGLLYLTPTGILAGDDIREPFIEKEKAENLRDKLIILMKEKDHKSMFDMVKGGKTGVSIMPKGINKTQVLKDFNSDTKIYFFGDNCQEGGNDHCLYIHERTDGYEVNDWVHCQNLLEELFLSN